VNRASRGARVYPMGRSSLALSADVSRATVSSAEASSGMLETMSRRVMRKSHVGPLSAGRRQPSM
jgi:hypothetical protein